MQVKTEFDPREVRELNRYLDKIEKNLGNTRPISVVAVSLGLEDAVETFRLQGRPEHPWPALKPLTIEARRRKGSWPGNILEDQGFLKQSLQPGGRGHYSRISEKGAEFGTVLVKARGLQGGLPERSGTTKTGKSFRFGKVPARAFLYWTRKTVERIMSYAAAFAFDPDNARRFTGGKVTPGSLK